MDVTKNIKDAGYIAVGAGVIGFQQAQVRRREISSEVTRRAQDARTCAEGQLASIRSQVTTQSNEVRSSVEGQALGAWERATSGISGVTGSISDGATGLADDVRELVEPVVGEARVRVEPLVEQLQTVPEHVARAVDASRTKVLGLVGTGTPATAA
jgi:phage-related protein